MTSPYSLCQQKGYLKTWSTETYLGKANKVTNDQDPPTLNYIFSSYVSWSNQQIGWVLCLCSWLYMEEIKTFHSSQNGLVVARLAYLEARAYALSWPTISLTKTTQLPPYFLCIFHSRARCFLQPFFRFVFLFVKLSLVHTPYHATQLVAPDKVSVSKMFVFGNNFVKLCRCIILICFHKDSS